MKFIILFTLAICACNNIHTEPQNKSLLTADAAATKESTRIKSFAKEAKTYCLEHGFNDRLFFLADMSLHSGKNRFFVLDMNSDSVVNAALVAHGTCGYDFLENAQFSNKKGCGCSSVGKYKIGGKYNGRFGVAYKLYGLDSTNSNAFARCIVLHSYSSVPDKETYPDPIGNSLGCPMVSINFLKQLETKIDKSSKPVLLWIVN